MWEALRKVAVFGFVLILSAGIYFLFYAEDETRRSVFDESLNLMGEKLLAMVPEGDKKGKLADLYADFKERAQHGQVAPKQVESVAANILNMSNAEASLTPEQAEAVLRAAWIEPAPAPAPEPAVAIAEEPMRTPPEPFELVGKRVKTMFKFNEEMSRAIEHKVVQRHELAKRVHYHVQDGLKLALDTSLKLRLEEKEMQAFAEEVRKLEYQRLSHWQEDLAIDLQHEMLKVKEELQSLHESLSELGGLQSLEGLQALQSLRSLEELQHLPVIHADSIRKVVEMSLRAAGVTAQKRRD
jgi:hypothetical protein